MAITNLNGVVAGMRPPEDIYKVTGTMEAAGVLHSLFYAAGRPGAAVAPTPGLAGAALTSYAGQIPWVNPASGNSYLARLSATASIPGSLILCDRLWHNSGFTITTTTAQTVNSVAFPSRCIPITGSTPDADGGGVMVAIEASAAIGNGAVTNTTMSYTNQNGTASRTATMSSFPASAAAGTFVPFLLQAGDTGVRSIQSLTLGTSYVSGTIHLVAYRKIATIFLTAVGIGDAVDAITGGFPRLYDDTVPFLIWTPTATTTGNIFGEIIVSQG